MVIIVEPVSSRDPWLDNAKMTFVTLAVVGHGWGLLPESVVHDRLYDFLYVWHMPALVLVSGYLSRRFSWTGHRLWVVVRTLVVPYLLFEAGLAWFSIRFGDASPTDLFLTPIWPLWYLVALVLWRLAAPLFTHLPAAVAVAASVAVSLLAGAVDWPYLDLSRVFGLLPFFVLGLVATPERLEMVRTPLARAIGLASLALAVVVVRDLDSWAGTQWLYYKSYEYVGVSALEGVGVRARLLLLAFGCTVGALALIPRRDGWYARMGAATMVVFLFHGFAQRALDYAGFTDWAEGRPLLALAIVTAGAVVLSCLLAAPPVARALEHLIDPVGWAEDDARRAVRLTMAVADSEQHERPTSDETRPGPDGRRSDPALV